MTKKTLKPTPAHMQKLADLMDTRPEGVTTRQVQNTLSVSPTLAKAALIEIGAVGHCVKCNAEIEMPDELGVQL